MTALSPHRLERILHDRILPWLKREKILKFYYVFMNPGPQLRLRVWKEGGRTLNLPSELLDLIECGEAEIVEQPFEQELETYRDEATWKKYLELSRKDSAVFVDFFARRTTHVSMGSKILCPANDVTFLIQCIYDYVSILHTDLDSQIKQLNEWIVPSLPLASDIADECHDWLQTHRMAMAQDLCGREKSRSANAWTKTRTNRKKLVGSSVFLARRLIHLNMLRHPCGLHAGVETALMQLTSKVLQTASHMKQTPRK